VDPTNPLTVEFSRRMIGDIATNATLRGSWAEQLVAHFLGVEELPSNWVYYDVRDRSRRDISVQHSIGPTPTFGIEMKVWAWDPELRKRLPETQGWHRRADHAPDYWCHAYVFAWLEVASAEPPLDDVLDPDKWQFAVLSRAEMYEHFGSAAQRSESARRGTVQKRIGLATLKKYANFVPGTELGGLMAAIPVIDDPRLPGVLARDMQPHDFRTIGPPMEIEQDSEIIPTPLDGGTA
jgi:hypothetical protein